MLDGISATVAHSSFKAEAIGRRTAGPVTLPEVPRHSEQLDEAPAPPVRRTSSLIAERWYCIQHEKYQGARARLNIRRAGFGPDDVHWPRAIIRDPRKDDVLEPLFPGYLFVRFDVRRAGWGKIRHAGNVLAILGVREIGSPIAIPHGEVERLIDLAQGAIGGAIDKTGDQLEEERLASILVSGTKLTFLDEALFANPVMLRADRGRERVEVMMTWFGEERIVSARRDAMKQAG